jgi:Glycosyl hydrolase-like 10
MVFLLVQHRLEGMNGAAAATPWQLSVNAKDFKRSAFVEPGMAERIKTMGNLSGRTASPSDKSSYLRGWVEYEVTVPKTTWYEFLVQPDTSGAEYRIDGKQVLYGYGGPKLSNLWLSAGQHTIRIQRYIWYGFSPITGFILRESSPDIAKRLQLELTGQQRVIRQRETLNLRIVSGGAEKGTPLTVNVVDKKTGKVAQTQRINVPSSRNRIETPAKITFQREGIYAVSLAVGNRAVDPADVRPVEVVVIDTSLQPRTGGTLQKKLLQEIDCTKKVPDYVGAGGTQVISAALGSYRESGNAGWIQQQHKTPIQPSWFAYTVTVPQAGKAYVVEVDYPDDRLRTFAITIRDRQPGVYPIAGGVDSGGEFALTHQMQTHSLLFWPNSTDLRVVLMTAQTGLRAAAAKIRLYQVQGDLPLLKVPQSGGRTFANWYEEGLHFASIYGGNPQTVEGVLVGAERWARAVAYMGGNLLIPTVAVYQMAMYPSRYNIDFNDLGTPDFVRMIQLKCEKYGLKMVGEFHPEARELEWLEGLPPAQRTNVLRDRQGKIASPNPPRHHPLHPLNQKWYLDMVGEFVERYQDSPALQGVSLRVMDWVNPGLNNFHSMDWGYDDYTLQRFQQDTGLKVPIDPADPERYRKRYDWLMAYAKADWIAWRSQKITELYRKVRDRVQRVRPDLQVYTDIFPGFSNLEDLGISVKSLANLKGVRLINALHDYGRRYDGRIYGGTVNQQHRDKLIDPAILSAMIPNQGNGAFLFGSAYFEAQEPVFPPEQLGFPPSTRATWVSAVVNPAGRHALERWAIALAETDASYLSDGGNGYTLGQPLLREFLQEYRHLPPVAFTPRPDARDPVAIWELQRQADFVFYAVNREQFPVTVVLTLQGNQTIRRLSTKQPVAMAGDRLTFTLQPYGLITFTAPAQTKIKTVAVETPKSHLAALEQQVTWLQQLNNQVRQNQTCATLTEAQKRTLLQMTQTATSYLQQRWIWHTRTILERHSMMELYNRCQQFPPKLRSLQ